MTDIAGASKAKITLVKSNVSESTALFHILGTPDNVKTAQYMMKVLLVTLAQNTVTRITDALDYVTLDYVTLDTVLLNTVTNDTGIHNTVAFVAVILDTVNLQIKIKERMEKGEGGIRYNR